MRTQNGHRSFVDASNRRPARNRLARRTAWAAAGRYVSERLEPRRLLATVNGTLGDDTFTIDIVGANIQVNRDGVISNFIDANETTIVINADIGNDTITILRNGTNTVAINGGDGNDTINVGNANFDATINANVTVNGGVGVDALFINDSADAVGSDAIRIGPASFKKTAFAETVVWTAGSDLVEAVDLTLGANADNVLVTSLQAGTLVTLNAGDGNDTIAVGSANDGTRLDNLLANLTVNGGVGNDSLYVDDRRESVSGDVYGLTTGRVGKGDLSTTITYASIAFLQVDSGITFGTPAPADELNQLFNVGDLGVLTTINAGAGNDTLSYGNGVDNLNLFDTSVTFNGELGTDRVSYNAQATLTAATYTVGVSGATQQISSTQNATLTLGTIEQIILNESTLSEAVFVNATLAGVSVTVNGGDGSDTLIAGNGDLDSNLLGQLVVFNGGAGSDSLGMNDSADGAGLDTYVLTANSVLKNTTTVRWSVLPADAVEFVSLIGANQASTYTVQSTNTVVTQYVVTGGTASDTYQVGIGFLVNIGGKIQFEDNGGIDSLLISDLSDAQSQTYSFDTSNVFTSSAMTGQVAFSPFIESAQLSLPAGAIVQTINVNAIGSTDLTIGAGDGNDTLNFGGDNWTSNVAGSAVSFIAGLGVDAVVVNDRLDAVDGDETYSLTNTALTKAEAASSPLFFTAAESLVVNTSGFADAFVLNAVTLDTTINGGNGNDTLSMGTLTPNDIDAILQANVRFNGEGGTDRVDLNDTGDTVDNDNYVLTGISFAKSSVLKSILFDTSETIALNANNGNNFIAFGVFGSTQSVSINGGAGIDLIVNTGTDLNTNLGGVASVTLVGGADSDGLVLSDASDLERTSYTINDDFILSSVGGTPVSIFYDQFESLDFTANGLSTTTDIAGLDNELTSILYFAGVGNDTLNLNGDLDGAGEAGFGGRNIELDGDGGTDVINVTDTDLANGLGTNSYIVNATDIRKDVLVDTVVEYYEAEVLLLTGSSTIGSAYFVTAVTLPLTVTGGTGADSFDITTGDGGGGAGGVITVNGGDGNDTLLAGSNASSGGLFNAGAGVDSLTYNDSLAGFAVGSVIEIGFNGVIRSGNPALDYDASLDRMSYFGNTAAHIYNVVTNKSGNLLVNTGDGDDTVNAGGGDVDSNFNGAVTLNGGVGTDRLNIIDTLDGAGGDFLDLAATSFNKGGTNTLAQAFESLVVSGSPQPTSYFVSNISIPTTINAGEGDDTLNFGSPGSINVGGGTIDATIVVNANGGADSIGVGRGDLDAFDNVTITVNGGAGADTINVDDTADLGAANTYSISGGIVSKTGATSFLGLNSSSSTIILNANAAANTINFDGAGTSAILNGNNGADTFNLIEGTATVHGGAGLDVLQVNQTEIGTAGFVIDQTEDLNAMSMFIGSTGSVVGNGTVAIDTNAANVLRGTLNLNNNFMVVRTTPHAFVVDKVTRGYNGGAWNGVPAGGSNGVIVSATAAASALADGIGYAEIGAGLGQLNKGTFNGVSLSPGNTLLAYTLQGDADLDRDVDFDDLLALARNYNATPRNWVQGDSNFNNMVDFDDLLSLAKNFNQSITTPAPALASLLATRGSSTRRTMPGGLAEDLII